MQFSPFSRPDGTWWPWDGPGNDPLNTDRVDNWEISPLELRRRLDQGDPLVLVDVRELWESDIAALPNARLIPLNELRYRAEEEFDPDDEVVLFCHHGIRSLEAAMILWDLGYEHVKSLAGGIERWTEQVDPGLPRY